MVQVECPNCSQALDVESGPGILATCPVCGEAFQADRQPVEATLVESPAVVEVQQIGYSPAPATSGGPVLYAQSRPRGSNAYRWIAGFCLPVIAFAVYTQVRDFDGSGFSTLSLILAVGAFFACFGAVCGAYPLRRK